MNDRFKFRVWDKINEIWVKNFSIDEQGYVEGFYNPPQAMNRRLVLMQCTGLKDKNGKLIYEGDIIKICCCNLTKTQISDVFFCQERSAFCFHYKTDYGDYANCTMEKTEIEVIGNIYENPELLKECKE